jgi:hypothetical protein
VPTTRMEPDTRIDDVGHAEAVDYRDFTYRPKEAGNKYYLSRWAELYFGRNRYTIQRDFRNSLYLLLPSASKSITSPCPWFNYAGWLLVPLTIRTSAGKLIPRSVEYPRRASSD